MVTFLILNSYRVINDFIKLSLKEGMAERSIPKIFIEKILKFPLGSES